MALISPCKTRVTLTDPRMPPGTHRLWLANMTVKIIQTYNWKLAFLASHPERPNHHNVWLKELITWSTQTKTKISVRLTGRSQTTSYRQTAPRRFSPLAQIVDYTAHLPFTLAHVFSIWCTAVQIGHGVMDHICTNTYMCVCVLGGSNAYGLDITTEHISQCCHLLTASPPGPVTNNRYRKP